MSKRIVFVYINRFKSYPIIYEYCIGLQKLGFEVHYIGIGDSNEHFVSDSGVQVTHYNKAAIRSRWHYAKLVRRSIKAIRPDLVHVFHFRWCFFIPATDFFSHRFLLDVRTVHVANSAGKYTAAAPLKNLLTWVESQFFRHAIALSEPIRKMLQPSFKKIPVIPLGANLDTFNPPNKAELRTTMRLQLGLTADEIAFIYVGTLNPARKVDLILQAFYRLTLKNERVRLVIAGDDKDNHGTLNQLINLANSLGIREKTVFTGHIQYDLLVQFCLAADVGLCYIPQTPFYNYQPPTKLFEYIAAGLVVIATKTKANEAIITDQVTGYLCNDNVEELAVYMEKVAQEYAAVKPEMTAKALQSIKNYSWDHIVANYLCGYYKTFLD